MTKELDANPPAAALTGSEKWAGIQSGADVTFTLSAILALASTPNATTAIKGKVKLAGDLAGTADLPLVPGLAFKANESAVVHNTGAEYVYGVKTFNNAPVVPSAAFPISATSGLQAALDAKAADSAVVHDTGDETIAGVKTATGLWNFHAASVAGQNYTGMAADFTGSVDDSALDGGVFNRTSASVTFVGGTNGSRGDDVTSTAANSDGTFFIAHWAGHGGSGFEGKGSAHGFVFLGALAAHASGAYGEMGGVVSGVTNNRPGGLAEAVEANLIANVQAKNASAVVTLTDNAGISGLAAYNWSRGLWIVEGGTEVAGDAIVVSGTPGWTNLLNFLNPSGAQRFRIDNTGKMFIGAGARTLYDDLAGSLKTDSVMVAAGFFSTGQVLSAGLQFYGDATRSLSWGTGSPEGAVSASVGSLYLRTDGGAATTLYVKESGASSTGWAAK